MPIRPPRSAPRSGANQSRSNAAIFSLTSCSSASGARSPSSTARWRTPSGRRSIHSAAERGNGLWRAPARRAAPMIAGSSAATDCHTQCALSARPAPQNHTLLTAGSPALRALSLTACAWSTIWISVRSAAPFVARQALCRPRRAPVVASRSLDARAPAPRIDRREILVGEMRVQRVAQLHRFLARDAEGLTRRHDGAVAHQPQVHRIGARPACSAGIAAVRAQRERAGGKRSVAELERLAHPVLERLRRE